MPKKPAASTRAGDTTLPPGPDGVPPSTAPVPMTAARHIGRGLAAVLAVTAAGVAIGEATGWPVLRQPLQNLLARATGVPVMLDGRFHARLLLAPQLEVEHLRVGAGGGVAVPHLIDARDLTLAWRWRDLWQWRQGSRLRVSRLEAGALDAHLVRLADGRASWQLGAPSSGNSPGEPASSDLDPLPAFGLLSIGRGRVRVDDQPLDTDLLIDVQGAEGASMEAGRTPGYLATVAGRWQALPLRLEVRAAGALPLVQDSDAQPGMPMVDLQIKGEAGATRVQFDGEAAALTGAPRLQGALRLRGPSLAQAGQPLGVTLPRTPPFDLAGQIAHAHGMWHLKADRMAIGSSLLNGDFRFDTRTRPRSLNGRLSGPRLALADLGPAVGAGADAAAAGPPGRVLPHRRLDVPSLRLMNADVQVAIDELDLGSDAVAPLLGLKTRVLLDGGVLRLQDLQARAAGGRFRGSTQLDANAEPARWGVGLRMDGIDVAGWLRGLDATDADGKPLPNRRPAALKTQRDQARQGGDQPVRSYVSGTLSGAIQATGAGRSTAEILGTLNGDAWMLLRDGTMSHLVTEAAGLDVAQALGVLVRGDRPLPLRCARMVLSIDQGVVRTRLAVLDSQDSTVHVGGHLDLRDETLALRAVARPKDISPLSLRTPLTVGGTLADPAVGIEGGALAGRLLGSAALAALAGPLAALLPLIDTGTGSDVDPCTATPPPAAGAASAPAAAARGR